MGCCNSCDAGGPCASGACPSEQAMMGEEHDHGHDEPCCASCAEGGPCEGCGGACGGNCDGRCQAAYDAPEPMSTSAQDAENYHAVMGTPLGDEIMKHSTVARVDDNILVSIRNPKGDEVMVVRLPFIPVMNFVQSLAMMHGTRETRPSNVMGYAPIVALLASQIAAKKMAEESGDKTNAQAKTVAPFDISSLLKMIPGLTSMAGVFYGDSHTNVADIIRSKRASVGAGCGCGVPCDGIQPNSPYMAPRNVARRNRVYRATAIRRGANYWDTAPVVSDQADNAFGRLNVDRLKPSEPVQVSGWTHADRRRLRRVYPVMGGSGCGC